MNKILRPLFSLLVLALVAGACTKEQVRRPAIPGGEGNHVTFTLNTGSLRAQGDETVTRPTPALEREKQITDLYAVVFKQGSGVFYKTVKCTLESGSTYTFDAQKPGAYYFFLIANPGDDLKAKLNAGPATKEALGQLIAEQTPGEGADANRFLMTSQLTQVTAVASETVPVAEPILLERVSARFDFYNRIEDFVITKITFKKRYTTSHLFPQVKKMAELTSTSDKEYTPTDGAAGLIATIYGYENDTRGETYFELEGIYKGQPIQPQEIRLKSFVIKRNHLYNIYLHTPGGETKPGDKGQPFDRIPYTVEVKDWAKGETLPMSHDNMLKRIHVDYAAHLSQAPYMDPYLKDSPKEIYSTTKEATTITLTLGNYIQAGSIEPVGTLPEGVTLSEVAGSEKKDPVTGRITKDYTLTLPARPGYDNVTQAGGAPKLHSFLEVKLVAAYRGAPKEERMEFSVLHGRPKMALEYLAEYNLAPVPGYTEARALTADELKGIKFADSQDNDRSGFFSPYYNLDQLKSVTINDKKYHFPTNRDEWQNIIPGSLEVGNNKKQFFLGAEAINALGIEEQVLYLPTYMSADASRIPLRVQADYRSTQDKKVTYALRFKEAQLGALSLGNLEQVAVRYEWTGNPQDGANQSALKITSRYLGANWNGDVERIATEDFWRKNNQNDVTRTLPLTGVKIKKKDSKQNLLPGYNLMQKGLIVWHVSSSVAKRDKSEDRPNYQLFAQGVYIVYNRYATSDHEIAVCGQFKEKEKLLKHPYFGKYPDWVKEVAGTPQRPENLLYTVRLFEDE